MTEKKELNNEELEKVSGGNYEMQCEGNLVKYNAYCHSVDVDSAVIGEKYLFFRSPESWLYGQLINRYGVYRTLDIKVEDGYGRFGSGIFCNPSSKINVSDYGIIEVRNFEILSNR